MDLPEYMTFEILARLPVKSLLRFKCVCKSWYALIKDPTFITKHLHLAQSSTDHQRIVLQYGTRSHCVLSLISNDAVELYHDVGTPFSDHDSYLRGRFQLYGPCNGIICMLSRLRDCTRIALWNPATTEFKCLLDSANHYSVFTEIGFGYDPVGNDYKVVRIRDFQTRNDEIEDIRDEYTIVDVYELRTDSWRKLDVVVPSAMRCSGIYSVYSCGFYYWWAGNGDDRFVLSFDFSKEVFEIIPSPDPNYHMCVTIFKFNESMALLGEDIRGDWVVDRIAVWVLERDGDNKTWIKQFAISFPPQAIGFLRSGKAVMIMTVGDDDQLIFYDQLILYDPSTQEIKNLQFDELKREPSAVVEAQELTHLRSYSLHIVTLAESLISFK